MQLWLPNFKLVVVQTSVTPSGPHPYDSSETQQWKVRASVTSSVEAAGARSGSGTFRTPILLSGLRRFVYLVRRGAGRSVELMFARRPT